MTLLRRFPRWLVAVAVGAAVLGPDSPAAAQVAPDNSTTTSTSGTAGSSTTTTTTTRATTTTTNNTPSGTTTTSTTATPAGDYKQVVDITFPADRRVTYTNTYHDPRAGGARVHKATDLMGTKHWKLYAAVAGTVCSMTGVDAPMPSYGYALSVCGDDGRRYNYIHINNDTPGTDDGQGGPEFAYAPRLLRGARVTRGQWIALLGDSGNAEGTTPHLHFEIEDPAVTDPYGSHRLDPYFSLQAARQRGDYPIDPGAPTLDAASRIAGDDRVATAIALSRAAFPTAPSVVIASSTSVADSIAAGPLAATLKGPVLITNGSTLDPRVVDEVRRLGATSAVLVGGSAALAPVLEVELADRTGIPAGSISRLAGDDRNATAAAVARRVWRDVPTSQRRAVVALGTHTDPARAWPDALTAGWLGAAASAPVLLVTLSELPTATATALETAQEAVVVGGIAAVTDAVFKEIQATVGATPRRLSGADRYATSAAVAGYVLSLKAGSLTTIWAMTGRSPADALAAGAGVARLSGTLVLIDGLDGRADAAAGRWLRSRVDRIAQANVLGGAKVVTDSALTRLRHRIT